MKYIYSLTRLGNLEFSPQCNVHVYSTFWSHHYVGHARKPNGRRRNHESASILSKIISIKGMVKNKRDKGPPECNIARGEAKALFHNNTKYAVHT